ncbi:tripartite tricarboxylate transporter substrate binding protein [Sabulicella rubraurantiaca]|uniref:tripartite tricarboxylate transporter substrate binding protein n=1 Tax=Sabulicella rubraurantiaca TaxID=2811429 RepID=UPI001A9564B8|nr:tripartite tricarboxylate transporter substrate binding protein [Sabulicella rubraurantiaca]
MQITKRGFAALLLLPALPASAQSWPSRPVRIVVPTGAGGITDILARLVGQRLSDRLGQPVVIENRPGAGGIVGTEAVARATPDGHTLLMVFPSHAVNPALRRQLPYDTERDFAPVGTVSTVSLVLLVPAASPARDVRGLIELARRERLTFASVGAGSLGHLGAELFRSMARIDLTHVPFRGAPEAQTALLRGDVSMFFDTPITALPMIREGRMRALGISTTERSPILPDVPTIAEAGVPGYHVTGWNGILAPAGTPPAVVDRLSRELREVLAEPEIRSKLAEQGADPAPTTPEAFAQRISADLRRWTGVIREAGIQPD